MRTSAPLLAAAISLTLLMAPARGEAEPTLRVRAETRLELGATVTSRGVEIRLTLRDDLGASIAGARVRLLLRGPQETSSARVIRTGGDGRFVGTLRSRGTVTGISARFEGDVTHAATRVERSVDPAQAETHLNLSLPQGTRLDLDQATHELRLHATSAAGGGGLRIEVFDELGRSLAQGRTDAEGDWRGDLPAAALGPVGAGRLRARSAGDARRADAQVELPIIRFRTPQLTLTTDRASVEEAADVRLRGRLSDSTGGIGERAVGLFAAGQHWATRLTDENGNYDLTLPLPDGVHSPFVVEARYESEGPGRPDAVSSALQLSVEERTSWAWLGLALPLIAMALLVAWGTRARRPRNGRAEGPKPPGTAASKVLAGKAKGRRREFDDLRGRVQDNRDGRALDQVRLRLLDGEKLIAETRSSAGGAFAFHDLPRGTLTLEVDAAGYELSTAAVEVPHRGQWSDARVQLRSLRWRVTEAFEPIAVEVLGSPERASTHTHREAAEASSGPLAAEVQQLAGAVERLAYGADVPERDRARALSERSERVVRALREEPEGPA